MTTRNISSISFFLLLLIFSRCSSIDENQHFLECLTSDFKNVSPISHNIFTPINSSYSPILHFSIQNLRFSSNSTPKPLAIITPKHESQIPPIIYCAKETGLQIRTRSGGHDYEGLSYASRLPFVIVDLINFSEITVDVDRKTAWVGSGATIGSLYYRIAEKSPVLGFPAGACTTIGVGGHFSGGGYGTMMRKHGLAADHVIDARIIDVNGRILNKKSMGEDLFWAIRGGGGASFGVILAWKVKLVDIPQNVTVFSVSRTLEENATQLIHKWQSIAPKLDHDLFIRIIITPVVMIDSSITVRAAFNSLFLGEISRLLPLMQESFPELNLEREDCTEMSWIESTLTLAGFPMQSREILLNRTQPHVKYFKAKSDYVQKPIPESGLEGIWRRIYAEEGEESVIILSPYGGRMEEIPESAIPFPHRAGNLYKIQYLVNWEENDNRNSKRYISWMRRIYSYMATYVSRFPRAAYLNYRDLDIGVNSVEENPSYKEARVWGLKYFKNNFDRLVRVKTMVDPDNFFRNEQSIPPLR
ncbi:FAD-binding Berberine family protein [Perilla frutescens var. hirtella]|nr:FAD-binding Berberine family protein [Perilla frutescens var. hirtella]